MNTFNLNQPQLQTRKMTDNNLVVINVKKCKLTVSVVQTSDAIKINAIHTREFQTWNGKIHKPLTATSGDGSFSHSLTLDKLFKLFSDFSKGTNEFVTIHFPDELDGGKDNIPITIKIKDSVFGVEATTVIYLLLDSIDFSQRAGRMLSLMKKDFKAKHLETLTRLSIVEQKLGLVDHGSEKSSVQSVQTVQSVQSVQPVQSVQHATQVFSIDPSMTDEELRKHLGNANAKWVDDPTAPGKAIQFTGYTTIGVGNPMFQCLPIDENSVFYMECWIQGDGSLHYMGSNDFDEKKQSLGGNPGSFGYWVMNKHTSGTEWKKVCGIIKGHGNAIGTFKEGAKYWSPLAYFNNGGGSCKISGWCVLKM